MPAMAGPTADALYPLPDPPARAVGQVPFEHFAGFVEPKAGMRVGPLELVADAAAAKKDWEVFDTDLLKAVLEFKWHGYSKHAFQLELFSFCVSLFVAFVFNIAVAVTAPTWTLHDFTESRWTWPLFFLYLANTAHVLITGRRTVRIISSIGLRKFSADFYMVLDLIYAYGRPHLSSRASSHAASGIWIPSTRRKLPVAHSPF